mmetsp:Transcript_91117/g.253830  ORF Transcript_91117/g.253830 Transcript_91117/m.253830 type:complete len:256 (-) Transcript_91117:104-871(-)
MGARRSSSSSRAWISAPRRSSYLSAAPRPRISSRNSRRSSISRHTASTRTAGSISPPRSKRGLATRMGFLLSGEPEPPTTSKYASCSLLLAMGSIARRPPARRTRGAFAALASAAISASVSSKAFSVSPLGRRCGLYTLSGSTAALRRPTRGTATRALAAPSWEVSPVRGVPPPTIAAPARPVVDDGVRPVRPRDPGPPRPLTPPADPRPAPADPGAAPSAWASSLRPRPTLPPSFSMSLLVSAEMPLSAANKGA